MRRAKILYLSYDGLTDPLGQAQILPYMLGLAEKYDITIISFEKAQNFNQDKKHVYEQVNGKLDWIPQQYTKRPVILASVFDLLKLRKVAKKVVNSHSFDIVHCRSYLTSIIGLWLKRKYNIAFLFDMRGLWADERVEGGLWNIDNPIYNFLYNYFKKLEKEFLIEANKIISLTNRSIEPLVQLSDFSFPQEKIEIIPCCVDIELFDENLLGTIQKNKLKIELGFNTNDKILIYVGSIGTWYMIDEMLDFYYLLHKKFPYYKLLIITRDGETEIFNKSLKLGIDPKAIAVKSARRVEVTKYLAISDLSYYFIRPTFSKLASSPTKLAEYMSMGIPIITNTNIGDVNNLNEHLGNGIILIDEFNNDAYEKAIDKIKQISINSRQEIISYAKSYFSLKLGIEKYSKVYQKMLH